MTSDPDCKAPGAGTPLAMRRTAQRATTRISCEAIKCYIDRHLHSADLRPEKAARSLRISQRYLHKVFAKSGSTFCQYVYQRRLEAARQALADPNAARRAICDIALEMGFYDHAHFSRAFRKAYGVSPREFRRTLPHRSMPGAA